MVDGLPVGHFDTVVLNSVVQYFPNAGYLLDVLGRCWGCWPRVGRCFWAMCGIWGCCASSLRGWWWPGRIRRDRGGAAGAGAPGDARRAGDAAGAGVLRRAGGAAARGRGGGDRAQGHGRGQRAQLLPLRGGVAHRAGRARSVSEAPALPWSRLGGLAELGAIWVPRGRRCCGSRRFRTPLAADVARRRAGRAPTAPRWRCPPRRIPPRARCGPRSAAASPASSATPRR